MIGKLTKQTLYNSKFRGMCFHEVIQHLLCFGSSHTHKELSPPRRLRSIEVSSSPVADGRSTASPRRGRSVSSTSSTNTWLEAALAPAPSPRAPPPTPRSAASQAADDEDESPLAFLDQLPALDPGIEGGGGRRRRRLLLQTQMEEVAPVHVLRRSWCAIAPRGSVAMA